MEFGPINTATDEQGHFRLEGLKSETYLLEARGQKPGLKETEPIQMHSPARKLSPEGDLKNVKLKLSVPGGFGGGCSDND